MTQAVVSAAEGHGECKRRKVDKVVPVERVLIVDRPSELCLEDV